MTHLKLYVLCLIVFFSIDMLWTGLIAKSWYQKELGHLLADPILLTPAVIFYFLYPIGLLLFAINPGLTMQSSLHALSYGAILGLMAYSAYDLTNLATIKNWPIKLAICDIIWGTIVSGAASWIVYSIGASFKGFFPHKSS